MFLFDSAGSEGPGPGPGPGPNGLEPIWALAHTGPGPYGPGPYGPAHMGLAHMGLAHMGMKHVYKNMLQLLKYAKQLINMNIQKLFRCIWPYF